MPIFDHFFSNYNYCWICWSWHAVRSLLIVLSWFWVRTPCLHNLFVCRRVALRRGLITADSKQGSSIHCWSYGDTCEVIHVSLIQEKAWSYLFLLSPLPQNTWTEAHTNLFPGLIYSCSMIIIQVKFWFNEQYGKCLQMITQVNFLFVNVYTDRYVKSNETKRHHP